MVLLIPPDARPRAIPQNLAKASGSAPNEVSTTTCPTSTLTNSFNGAEYLYDMFLVGYINGIYSFLDKSSSKARSTGMRDPAEKWHSALSYGEMALRLA